MPISGKVHRSKKIARKITWIPLVPLPCQNRNTPLSLEQPNFGS